MKIDVEWKAPSRVASQSANHSDRPHLPRTVEQTSAANTADFSNTPNPLPTTPVWYGSMLVLCTFSLTKNSFKRCILKHINYCNN